MPENAEPKVQHELVRQRGKICLRRFDDVPYDTYLVRLFLTGDLSDVASVRYELHPSFPDPVHEIRKRRGGFPLEFWTWGEFEVDVTLQLRDGTQKHLPYYLEYSDELPEDDDEYVDQTPGGAGRRNG